jgi:uncharacterized protein (DUF427 family)
MKAVIDKTTIAETNSHIEIEGNYYFPPEDVNSEMLAESDTSYTCPWKGEAQYFDIVIDGEAYGDAAWSYPNPKNSAIEKVGSDFADHIAFEKSQVNTQ